MLNFNLVFSQLLSVDSAIISYLNYVLIRVHCLPAVGIPGISLLATELSIQVTLSDSN